MSRKDGFDVVVMDEEIDNNFMSFHEYKKPDNRFQRVDSELSGEVSDNDTLDKIRTFFKKALNNDKLDVKAMAMGKAVVTTTLGAQGIDYTDGEHLLIANTPEEFAQQIKRLLDDSDYCRRVGEAAARLVAEEYDVDRLTARLLRFYNERIDL